MPTLLVSYTANGTFVLYRVAAAAAAAATVVDDGDFAFWGVEVEGGGTKSCRVVLYCYGNKEILLTTITYKKLYITRLREGETESC